MLLALCGLYAVGLGMRRHVLEAQTRAQGMVLPFTLESALQFRRVAMVYETGRLPVVDRAVQYPEGVHVASTYTVGSEYVYAFLARLAPDRIPLAERIRWIEAGWFCLGIPLLAAWAGLLFRSRGAGAVAGLLYAVCLSGLIRSTGQELSRENFALPWVIAFLLLDLVSDRAKRRPGWWAAALGSAVCLAAAMVSWDLVQYMIGLWFVARWWELARGRWRLLSPAGGRWALQCAALAAAGCLHPYLRAHGFLTSPVMGLGYGLLLGGALASRWTNPSPSRRGSLRPSWVCAALAAAPALALLAGFGPTTAGYGHFADLLLAKLVHLNQKPADPSLLTFNQRIMWVPALHSANIRLTLQMFPAILPLGFVSGLVIGRSVRARGDLPIGSLVFFTACAFLTFCFFVRFHVFLAIFGSALVGGLAAWAWTRRDWTRWGVLGLVGAGLLLETGQVLYQPTRWGRSGVYYRDVLELVEWLDAAIKPRPVLANFGVGGMILAYGGCPILLHPKFESEGIRERVREYGEILFTGTEEALRDWALGQGARYYVYGRGEFADIGVPYQMRYFVNALDPPPTVPARLFEAENGPLAWFQPVWQNRKYKVYRIRAPEDAGAAAARAAEAEACFQRGDLAGAERAAMEALTLDPRNELALKMVTHVENLRDAGFGYEPE
jgi:hypothetical protein